MGYGGIIIENVAMKVAIVRLETEEDKSGVSYLDT